MSQNAQFWGLKTWGQGSPLDPLVPPPSHIVTTTEAAFIFKQNDEDPIHISSRMQQMVKLAVSTKQTADCCIQKFTLK